MVVPAAAARSVVRFADVRLDVFQQGNDARHVLAGAEVAQRLQGGAPDGCVGIFQ